MYCINTNQAVSFRLGSLEWQTAFARFSNTNLCKYAHINIYAQTIRNNTVKHIVVMYVALIQMLDYINR